MREGDARTHTHTHAYTHTRAHTPVCMVTCVGQGTGGVSNNRKTTERVDLRASTTEAGVEDWALLVLLD